MGSLKKKIKKNKNGVIPYSQIKKRWEKSSKINVYDY